MSVSISSYIFVDSWNKMIEIYMCMFVTNLLNFILRYKMFL